MDRYMKFDIERFLKDSRGWLKEIRKKQAELDDLFGLPELSQETPVQTSNISDITGTTASRREPLIQEIERLSYYVGVLDNALSQLSEQERDLIDTFFFSRGYMYARVDEYAYKWGRSIPSVYIDRRETLNKLSDLIAKK